MAGPIFYFTRALPQYRVDVLNRLNKALSNRLVAFYGAPPKGSTLGSLSATGGSFRSMKLKNLWWRGEKLHWQSFRPAFEHFGRPSVILAEESPRSLSLPLLLLYARIVGIPVVLWGHFSSNNRPFSSRNLFDRYRMALAQIADACVAYSEEVASILRRFVDAERVFVAPNTLNTERLSDLHESLAARGREMVRRDLALPINLPCLVFIGRLTTEKGIPFLVRVMAALHERRRVAWIVIGDGPGREIIEDSASDVNFPKVHLTGALRDPEDSAPYLFAADLLVLPGPAGLAVNHGFAFGLPAVAQRSPGEMRYHGPEGAYLEHGSNSMLADYGDVTAFVDGIEHVLDRRDAFSCCAKEYAERNLSIEIMVDGLIRAIRSIDAK